MPYGWWRMGSTSTKWSSKGCQMQMFIQGNLNKSSFTFMAIGEVKGMFILETIDQFPWPSFVMAIAFQVLSLVEKMHGGPTLV